MNPLENLSNRVGRNNLIAIVGIIILLILAFLLLSGASPLNQLFRQGPTPTPTPKAKVVPTTVPGDTIMLTFTRPVPATLTTKKGRVVNFANFSGARVDIEGVDEASKELNIGILEDNDTSREIIFKSAGTYKYLDKLNPKIAGQIVVTN